MRIQQQRRQKHNKLKLKDMGTVYNLMKQLAAFVFFPVCELGASGYV